MWEEYMCRLTWILSENTIWFSCLKQVRLAHFFHSFPLLIFKSFLKSGLNSNLQIKSILSLGEARTATLSFLWRISSLPVRTSGHEKTYRNTHTHTHTWRLAHTGTPWPHRQGHWNIDGGSLLALMKNRPPINVSSLQMHHPPIFNRWGNSA